MLKTINKIRDAFTLPPVKSLFKGKTNAKSVELSLGHNSKLTFFAGTNYIDAVGDFYGDANKDEVISSLEKVIETGKAWKTEEGISFWTPNDISDFLKQ